MKYLFLLSCSFMYLFSNTPVMLFGTNIHKDDNLNAYLSTSKIKNNWQLNHYVENLLEKKYSDKLKKLDIIFKKDFINNLDSIDDVGNRKIAFFHIKTHQNAIAAKGDLASANISFNTTFIQIGEESNRTSDTQNSFEVKYTYGNVNHVQTTLDEKHTLDKIYKLGIDAALSKLLDSMIEDKENKEVYTWNSKNIYFSIDYFKIKKSLNNLIEELYINQKTAKDELIVMLQESLIKKIRKDNKLDDIVLLYPSTLNKVILENWEEYLIYTKELKNRNKSRNANIVIRKLAPICDDKPKINGIEYLNGYKIQAFLTDLKNEITDKKDTEAHNLAYSSTLSRIILQLNSKVKIDGISTPTTVIKKSEMFSGQGSEGLAVIGKNNYGILNYHLFIAINSSIDEMSEKIVEQIRLIVKNRKNKNSSFFEYENFCKDIK